MLKFKLESLDGLDEALKGLYKKGEDGKFTLDLDEDPAKTTIQKLRKERDDMEATLKAREKSEADEKAKKEREDLEKKGEYEKLSAADKAALKAALDDKAALETKLRNGARDRALLEAMSDPSVKGIAKALLPHIKDLVEVVPDGDGFKAVSKANPAQKITELIASLKPEMPWGFEGPGANGSGTNPGGGGNGSNARYLELQSQKEPLTNAQGIELVKLAAEVENATKKP